LHNAYAVAVLTPSNLATLPRPSSRADR
jgi:hypothetical protein